MDIMEVEQKKIPAYIYKRSLISQLQAYICEHFYFHWMQKETRTYIPDNCSKTWE